MVKDKHLTAGFTLVEVTISMAVCTIILGGLMIGLTALQKTFKASQYYVNEQAQQLRYLDYLSLDLRRALTLTTSKSVSTLTKDDIIDITIPDFYKDDPSGSGKRVPRDPVLVNGVATYGTVNPAIRYYKSGNNLIRKKTEVINGVSTVEEKVLCDDIETFLVAYEPSPGQVVSTSVSFIPRFQWSSNVDTSFRQGTTTYTSTLLRSTRQVTTTK